MKLRINLSQPAKPATQVINPTQFDKFVFLIFLYLII